jgi:hypothetical protein
MRMSESNMGSLLAITIQLLKEAFIVEMNIEAYAALQKFQCCDAAKPMVHSGGKKWLTLRHAAQWNGHEGLSSAGPQQKITITMGVVTMETHEFTPNAKGNR